MVISLPRITDVLKGKVPALIPELLTQKPFNYLPMEYHTHLMAIIDILKKYENLEIFILPNKHMLHTVQLFAVTNGGLLVLKHRDPKFVFISEENDLIGAIISFINQESARIPKRRGIVSMWWKNCCNSQKGSMRVPERGCFLELDL